MPAMQIKDLNQGDRFYLPNNSNQFQLLGHIPQEKKGERPLAHVLACDGRQVIWHADQTIHLNSQGMQLKIF